MYSDYNRRQATRRSNDEFLRRMLGGEVVESALPAMNEVERPSLPVYPEHEGPRCDGTVNNGNPSGACGMGECPTCIPAPSLAMVYAPRQCWRNLLQPQAALEHGSLFAELVLPLEVVEKRPGREVRGRC